jgi:hypothetical protein
MASVLCGLSKPVVGGEDCKVFDKAAFLQKRIFKGFAAGSI